MSSQEQTIASPSNPCLSQITQFLKKPNIWAKREKAVTALPTSLTRMSSGIAIRAKEEQVANPESSKPEALESSAARHGDTPQWVTGLGLIRVMIALTLVSFLILLDTSILASAVPYITNDFKSLTDVGWYGAAYQLSNATLQLLTGKIYTNFNTKVIFLVFFLVFELGSLVCALAISSEMLIVGRALAGMGVSGVQNGCFTIISACVPLQKRPMLFGIAMGVSQLGLATGPLIGGALTEYATWRWCFWINLPIGGLIAGLIVLTSFPDNMAKPNPMVVIRSLHNRLDFLGFILFAACTIQLLLALQYGGNQYPWNSSVVIGLFCGAGLNFSAWFVWDWYKGDNAMLPFSMIRKTSVWASCLTYGFGTGTLIMMSYYLPIYFQGVQGASPLMSGIQLLPNIIPQLLMGILCGRLVSKIRYYLPFSLFGTAIVAISNGIISLYSPTTSLGNRIGFQILMGVGYGCTQQMPMIAIQNSIPRAQIPVATGMLIFTLTLSGSLFLSFGDTIFTNSLKTLLPEFTPSLDPSVVITAGATGLRHAVSPAALNSVLIAYAKSVDRVFLLGAAFAAASFCFAWGMGWKDIRKKNAGVEPKV